MVFEPLYLAIMMHVTADPRGCARCGRRQLPLRHGRPADGRVAYLGVEPNYTRQKWDFLHLLDGHAVRKRRQQLTATTFLVRTSARAKTWPRRSPPGNRQAVEPMVKVSSVRLTDGEQALWIDGQPIFSNYSGTASPQVISVFRSDSPLGGWITAHFCPDTRGLPFSGDTTTPSRSSPEPTRAAHRGRTFFDGRTH